MKRYDVSHYSPARAVSGLAASVVATATLPARLALKVVALTASAVGEPDELEMLVRARLLD